MIGRSAWLLLIPAVLALVLVSLALARSSDRTLDAISDPGILWIQSTEVDANPASELSAWVEIEASIPSSVHVEATSGDHRLVFTSDATARRHRMPMLGFRPDRDYELAVQATTGGRLARARDVFRSGALPADMPVITTTGDAPAGEWTLFPAMRFGATPFAPVRDDVPRAYIVALDESGEVVWYHTEAGISTVEVLDNGNLVYLADPGLAIEITPMNEVVREWRSRAAGSVPADELLVGDDRAPAPGAEIVDVDVDSLHHDLVPLDDGTFMTLSTTLEFVRFPAPQCGEAPSAWSGGYEIISDRIIELDTTTGEIVFDVNLTDVLDPVDRPGWAMCGPQAQPAYDGEGVVDWSHANALTVDPANNAVLVSNRHLDLVIALRHRHDADGPAGEVLWELGPEGDVDLVDGRTWFSGQHSIRHLPDGTFLLYDNGVQRGVLGPSARTGQFTRALRLDIDGEAKTARIAQTHTRRDESGDPLFAIVVGDVDRLASGNWVVTDGGQIDGSLRAEIVEVDPTGGPIVHEIDVRGDGDEGWVVYRSERVDPFG